MSKLMRRVHEYTTKSGKKGILARAKYYNHRIGKTVKSIICIGKTFDATEGHSFNFMFNGGIGSICLPCPTSGTTINGTGVPIANFMRKTLIFPIVNGCIKINNQMYRILAIEYVEDNVIDVLIPSKAKGNNNSIDLVVGKKLFDLYAEMDIPQSEVCLVDKDAEYAKRGADSSYFGGLMKALPTWREQQGDFMVFSTRKRKYVIYESSKTNVPLMVSNIFSGFSMTV